MSEETNPIDYIYDMVVPNIPDQIGGVDVTEITLVMDGAKVVCERQLDGKFLIRQIGHQGPVPVSPVPEDENDAPA